MGKMLDSTPLAMSQRLQTTMQQIGSLCTKLDGAGKAKAEALVDYEAAYAIAIVSRRDEGMQATLIKDIAKADVRDDRFKCELAEVKYKCLITKIDAYKAILNGQQSLNRYLDSL